jgi:hypothetical protein
MPETTDAMRYLPQIACCAAETSIARSTNMPAVQVRQNPGDHARRIAQAPSRRPLLLEEDD